MTERPTDPYGRPQPLGYDQPAFRPTEPDDQGTAKGEARRVADTATSAGSDVAHTAKDQAAQVAAETKHQAASLLDTVRTEVGDQASTQQQRIADALHGLSKELGSMASSSSESGWVTDMVHEASRRGGEIAHWLHDREPADVLDAVYSYARRRPGTFLALCGLAGVVAGRITRSTVATRTSLDSPDGDRPRALTEGTARGRSGAYPAVEPTTPVGPSTGTVATETNTVSVPTAASGPQDPLVSELEASRSRGSAGLDPLAPGGDPTR